jgi:hypothetical protein
MTSCQKRHGKNSEAEALDRKKTKDNPSEIPFESALLRVSHCLTEAEAWAERGSPRRANHLFHLAESYALQSGYLELLSLVWAYKVPSISYAAPATPPSV